MGANSVTVTSWLLCIFVGEAHVLHMFHLQMYMQEHLFTDTCAVDLWRLIHVLLYLLYML